ncbi:MAG: histidine phosphatase family protein [Phototrophicaceae bacterium]
MQLLLIRHAQSVNNVHEERADFQHIEDCPLTAIGHSQANHLASVFRRQHDDDSTRTLAQSNSWLPLYHVDKLYSSPMQRTLQTAQPIAAALDMPIQLLMDAYEIRGVYREQPAGVFTSYPGLTREKMAQICPNAQPPQTVTHEGWHFVQQPETVSEFTERVARFAAEILRRAGDDWAGDITVGLLTHGTFAAMLIHSLLFSATEQRHMNAERYLHLYNTSLTRLSIVPNRTVRLDFLNSVAHLPPQLMSR